MDIIPLSRWDTRIWAWVIDFILISILVNILTTLLQFTFPLTPFNFKVPFTFDIGLQSVTLFLYWTILEGYHGRSIGKMVLNIRVTGRSGERIGFGTAAIESFGKAFLLPLDCLIGWLAMPNTKLRLFNRLSNTIVRKTEDMPPEGIQYVKEKE